MVVRPGPAFSVADVARGWVRGMKSLGCNVYDFAFDDRLDFYSQIALNKDGEWREAVDRNGAVQLAAKSLEAAIYEFWPDVIVIVSCFFVPKFTLEVLRSRPHKVVIVHTESPYEDQGQLRRAPYADLNVLNDPTNLEQFQAVAPSVYLPHAFDPELHYRRSVQPELASDFCFVGTGFPSRVEFFESVDWTGIDAAFAGMWLRTSEDSPLRKFLAHDIDACVDNSEVPAFYSSAKVSANLYRREAETAEQEQGWSMGPREVELAACGTFFLRDPRPEGDDILWMLPTFDGPDDFGEQLRWWLARDDRRDETVRAARAAVAGRTFATNAAACLRLLEKQRTVPA